MDTININQDQNGSNLPAAPVTQPPEFPGSKPPGKFKRLLGWIKAHKVKAAIIALLIIAALGAAGFLYWKNHQPIDSPEKLASKQKTTAPSPLTGVEVPKELAGRPVTGIIIENTPDARPQSSLSDAGVVFEAVAEGGITRFLALYQESAPKNIGPVRSLRPYYLEWGRGYDAAIAHVGGSAPALYLVSQYSAKDLNQMNIGEKGFWRVSDRAAPHNVYTSFEKLDALNTERGYTKSEFKPYARKKDEPAQQPTATAISVEYSGPLYGVQFQYDQPNNRYLRVLSGTAHIDRENNQQIAPKNVVVLNMPTSYNGVYAEMPAIGEGSAVVFRDGIAIKALWKKASSTSMVELKAEDGSEIALNRGQTWFAIHPTDKAFAY